MPVVGDLKVRITATTQELRANLAKASSLIRDWSLLSTGLTRGVTTAFKNLASIGIKAVKTSLIGLGATMVAITARGASFQDNLVRTFSILKRSSKATEGDFKLIQNEARKLGRETIFSATQASEGMLILARSGQTTKEVIKSIGPALDLASIGGLGLADSSKIVTQTLAQFGLGAKEAGRVADVLALGSVKANTSVAELGTALSFVGNISKESGLTLEETTAAILVLSNAGIRGTRAGTSLRQTFSKLLSPTGRAKKIFKEYGINVKKSNGELKPLPSILQEIGRASLDAGEILDAFGRRAGPAVLALINASKQIDKEFIPDLNNAKDSSREMGQEIRTSLIGRLKDLGASLDNLGGAFFDNFVLPASEGIFSIRNFSVAIEDSGKKTGFFKNVIKGMGVALEPISKLLSDLSQKFLTMFKNITASDISAFFDNIKVKIEDFIKSASSGQIKETLVASFEILKALISSILVTGKIFLSIWKSVPDSIKPIIGGFIIIGASIISLVGGILNIIISLVAIRALAPLAFSSFIDAGKFIATTMVPSLIKVGSVVTVILAKFIAIAALILGGISLFRFLSELKFAGTLIDKKIAGWKLLGAQITLATSKAKLFGLAVLRKDTSKAADQVVKNQGKVALATQNKNKADQATIKAVQEDFKLFKNDFNPANPNNRVQKTLEEIKTIISSNTTGVKAVIGGITPIVPKNTKSSSSLPQSSLSNSVLEITRGLPNSNKTKEPVSGSGFINFGEESLKDFVASIDKIGTKNIDNIKVSGDNVKQAIIKTKEGMSIMSTVIVSEFDSLRAQVEALGITVTGLTAQVKKPSNKTIKQSKPSSGL